MFICGSCRAEVPGNVAACPACGFSFASSDAGLASAPSSAPSSAPARPAYSQGLDGPQAVALVSALTALGCFATMTFACLPPGSSMVFLLVLFAWNGLPSAVAFFAAGPGQPPAFRCWVGASSFLVAVTWMALLAGALSSTSGSCQRELGWTLLLGPVLYLGIVILGIVVGAIASAGQRSSPR